MPFSQWQAGQIVTADALAAISPTWDDWQPVWTTSTGSATPSFGDATITARYAQSADTVWYRLEITFGATTNFGGGGTGDNWRFSLPVTAASTMLITGMGEIQFTSQIERIPVRCRLHTVTDLVLELSGRNYNDTANNSSGLVDAVTPWTWASGNAIRMAGTYEAA
jgi:hypothetical protein